MTKVIVLGCDEKYSEKKSIVFTNILDSEFEITSNGYTADEFKFIELICKDYGGSSLDLMFAYDDDRNCGLLFIGNFNDGIV